MGSGAIERETSRSRVFSLSDSGGDLREDFSSSMMSSMGTWKITHKKVKLLVKTTIYIWWPDWIQWGHELDQLGS